MSRRARAVGFLSLALLAAILSAAFANGYGERVSGSYGPLRRVAVAVAGLRAGKTIDAGVAAAALATRRVPTRFVPPGALSDPGAAIGLAPIANLSAGTYLTTGQLRSPGGQGESRRKLGGGRQPVEILVSGAGALLAAPRATGVRVDVIVTAEPTGAAPGRTYIAAAAVPLLALAVAEEGAGASGSAAATLGLRRAEALRLIAAESFARRITLLPRG